MVSILHSTSIQIPPYPIRLRQVHTFSLHHHHLYYRHLSLLRIYLTCFFYTTTRQKHPNLDMLESASSRHILPFTSPSVLYSYSVWTARALVRLRASTPRSSRIGNQTLRFPSLRGTIPHTNTLPSGTPARIRARPMLGTW